jgi:hypothetical protein
MQFRIGMLAFSSKKRFVVSFQVVEFRVHYGSLLFRFQVEFSLDMSIQG